MNDRYNELKKEYDAISVQISELYAKQRDIRDLMEKECTHERLIKVDSDPFLVEMDVEDEETKYKCKDCYIYFTSEEVKQLREEQEKNFNE